MSRPPILPAAIDKAVAAIQFDAQGLVPAIAQQHDSGEILMMAWMDRDAVAETMRTGRVCYWSRSRKAPWRKGDTSGHIQTLVDLRIDCDGDTLLVLVDQKGVACHTGRHNCFFRAIRDGALETIAPVMIDMDTGERSGRIKVEQQQERTGAASPPPRRPHPARRRLHDLGPVRTTRASPATRCRRAATGWCCWIQKSGKDNMMAPEALALMGITNEGRDIPVRQIAQEEGESRFVVSLTNIRKIHDLIFMRRQGDVLLLHLSDTKFTRLASVRYPRNGKPSVITDTTFAENDFQQQIGFWFKAMPGR